MRILAITNLYPSPLQPNRAPYNRHQFRLLAELHDVQVIAPVLWTDEWAAGSRLRTALPALRRVVHDGLVVDHPRYWYTPKMFRGMYGQFFRASIERTFNDAVANFQPDLVFAPWAYPDGFAAVRLAHRAGLPCVVQVHGSDLRELDRFAARTPGTAAALREADGIIAVSRELADRVIRLGTDPSRVRAVIDGVDKQVFFPGDRVAARDRLRLPGDMRHLLFVGNLVAVKGLDILLDACRQLQQSHNRWQLHVIGDGPLRPRLKELAGRCGVADRVVFHGVVPHSELPDWFRAADLFVLSSRSEGVPNVLLEAAACGLPFVATKVGGVPEIAGLGASRLVSPEDATALAAAIAEMFGNPPAVAGAGPRERREAVVEIAAFLESCAHRRNARQPVSAAAQLVQ